jgi:hypothetical protein
MNSKNKLSQMGRCTAQPQKKYWINCTLFGLLFLIPSIVFAQNATPITRISGELTFDGKLDEPFWGDIESLDMTMYQPVYRGDIEEKNEIYLAYDEDYVYLAARLYHKNSSDIRSNSLYRDQYSSDDTFALILDTFNDNENALWFFTTPAGTRFDVLVSNDGNETNFDWNTYWNVRTDRSDWGWSVEMRIPFSSLGFQSSSEEVVMGAIVYRYLSKLNQRYIYPAIPPNWDNGFRKPSQAKKILLKGIESENPVYITPYLLGGIEQRTELNANTTEYEKTREWTHEPGGDVKLNLTSNLTMDLTVNTDFAQVEADNQQINLTRFPLFFPEKRQFFQERSSVFNFGFTRDGRLFHSRRIGLSETGEPIRIYGGARMVGKLNNTDVGFINMQTAASSNLPSENFSVLRVKRKVFNRYSTIGAMFTSRIGTYENDNYAYGMDAVIRVTGDEYMTLKVAQTYQDQDFDLLSNSRFYFQWQRRRNDGLSYNFDFDRSGASFNPEVGFTRRSDFSLFQNRVQYKWLTDESLLFQGIWINNFSNAYLRHADKQIESAVINPHAGANFKSGASYTIQTNIRYENLLQSFSLSDNVTIPAGEYWYPDIEMRYESPGGWKFRPGLSFGMGGFFDGSRSTLGVSTNWNLSSHFEIGNEYEYNKVRFADRGQEFDAHIARLRFRIALNTKVSLTSFIQYNTEIENTSIDARFRYNIAEGDDLWIVYDNVINTVRSQVELPRLPASNYQAILVKFTYTFKLLE